MDITRTRIEIIGLIFAVYALSACQSSSTTSIPVETEQTDYWQTYINAEYGFSFQYPSDWQINEKLIKENSTQHKEIWFTLGDFPPTNTNAQPDLTLIFTEGNPVARWRQEYFDEYRSDVIQLGDGTAAKISGINKEALYKETVVILKLEDVYLQFLPGQNILDLEVFDHMLDTFESVESPTADIYVVENFICIAPYFDPIAVLPGNDRILFRSDLGIMVFDLKTLEKETVLESSIQVIKAALSPDGETLAWALEDHRIEIIELSSGKILNTLTGHTGFVTAIKFSKTGDRIFTASHDNSVKVWDIDGSLVYEFYPGGGEVLGIGVSPDETKMAIVTFEGPQKLWDFEKNVSFQKLDPSGAFDGSDAGFSSNGRVVSIGLGGGPTSLWDIDSGTQLWSGGNYALIFSPDGKFMAYSDVDINGNNLIQVRSMVDQQLVQTLMGHMGLIWKLFFSTDGSMLVSNSNDIRVWRTSDGKLLHEFIVTCK